MREAVQIKLLEDQATPPCLAPTATAGMRAVGLFVVLVVPDAAQDCADDERQSHGRVVKNFGEFSAFFRRNKLSPGDSFGVRAAAQAAPMHRLRTNSNTVVVSFEGNVFVTAT